MSNSIKIRDISKYSKSTVNVRNSMNKWVDKFIIILQENPDSLISEIHKLNFSVGYLNSIIRTLDERIVANNLNLRIPDAVLKLKKRKRVNKKRNTKFYEEIKKMTLFALERVVHIERERETGDLINRCTLEAYVVIILVFLTALRSNEISQLTIHDLYKIKMKLPIYIRIKKRNKPVVVSVVTDFYELIYPKIIYVLAEAYDNMDIKQIVKTTPRFTAPDDKERFLNSSHTSSIKDALVFTCHKSTLNKEIKDIYRKANKKNYSAESVGPQAIRGLVLTELINMGDPQIAALFTRHQKPSTTMNYYNFPDLQTSMDGISEV